VAQRTDGAAVSTVARPSAQLAGRLNSLPPQVLLLGGIASVQFGAAFANKLFDRAGPGGVVLLRLALGALLMVVIARPSLRGRTRSDWIAVTTYGLILGVMNWMFYEGLDRLPIGVAVTIEFTGPLAVAVAGSRRALDGLWVVLAGGGVALLALRGDRHGVTASGIVFILIAAACWAAYILVSKRVGQSFTALDGLSIAFCIGTLVAVPAGIVEGGTAILQPAVIAGGLAAAVLSSILPYSLELVALRRLSAAAFGLLMCLEPAVAALVGVVVLGQPLTAILSVAIVLVVAASVGTTLTQRVTVDKPPLPAG
jgi:inner membrane transporter RhtA